MPQPTMTTHQCSSPLPRIGSHRSGSSARLPPCVFTEVKVQADGADSGSHRSEIVADCRLGFPPKWARRRLPHRCSPKRATDWRCRTCVPRVGYVFGAVHGTTEVRPCPACSRPPTGEGRAKARHTAMKNAEANDITSDVDRRSGRRRGTVTYPVATEVAVGRPRRHARCRNSALSTPLSGPRMAHSVRLLSSTTEAAFAADVSPTLPKESLADCQFRPSPKGLI